MNARTIDHLFSSLKFHKPASEIVAKASEKAAKIRAKVEERQKRVAALRKEYEIDDAALIQLLTAARKNSQAHQFAYSSMSNATMQGQGGGMKERTIGAGVVNNLLTENDFIEAEKDQAERLDLIVRNLKPIARYADGDGSEIPPADFQLTYEELEFLGF